MAFNSFNFKLPFVSSNTSSMQDKLDLGSGELVEIAKTRENSIVSSPVDLPRVSLAELKREPSEVINLDLVKNRYSGDKELGARRAPRYHLEMEAIIMGQGRSTRTVTENVSVIGCYLRDALPQEFNTGPLLEVVLVFRHNEQAVEYFLFHARPVDAPLRSHRLQFVRSVGGSLERLGNLFQKLELEPS
ncbi:MAG: hypothetical protein N2Z70_03605 [Bdellovibrionaceae bacterium]|nr:hypothetical protein [Pseudobdellovibrionaceae bacterium]